MNGRPKLASMARLRWDEREGKYLLLSPERGLLLDDIAAHIVKLCDGTRTVDEIISELQARYRGTDNDIESDARAFLAQLRGRALLEGID
jgi:coenzyme PQQ biosynthesis protein PqqD